MIHYHGTPIGGSRQDAARFLSGRHALVPFLYQNDLGAVLEYAQSFMLDNSAFSYWKAGHGRIDFDQYCAWVDSVRMHPSFDFALIPDVIDGSEDDNRSLITKWMMHWHGKEAFDLGAPVWHLHESLEWLAHLVRVFPVVAIGSSGQWKTPGTESWWKRMSDAMQVACNKDGAPKCRLHGLRMLDPEIFSRLPFRSADSTNAAVNSGSVSRFGQYVPATAWQRAAVIADRVERFNSAAQFDINLVAQSDLFTA
jgi:hypothetical protein